MTEPTGQTEPLQFLKSLFIDQPHLLKLFEFSPLTGKELFDVLNNSEMFLEPINLYITGRTGAGKSTLCNNFFEKAKKLFDESKKLLETGTINTTKAVQCFHLESNMTIIDLPGPLGKPKLENINRAALLIEQKEGRRYSEITDFPLVNYSDTSEIKTEEVSVKKWQSPAYQKHFAPDIILYVIAPHMQFLEPDYEYLCDLLKFQKSLGRQSRVVFALNVFDTMEHTTTIKSYIEDTKESILEAFEENGLFVEKPPIFEVNCLTGIGFDEVTTHICKILPQEKLGKIEKVLNEGLKIYAQKERSNWYRKAVYHIASRIASYPVDQEIDGQNLLEIVVGAIHKGGLTTFVNKEAISQFEFSQSPEIKELINTVKKSRTEVTVDKIPILGKVAKTYEEQEIVEMKRPKLVPYNERDEYEIQYIGDGRRVFIKRQTVQKTRMEDGIVGYKDKINQQCFKGGYPAIVFLVGFSLGVEKFYTSRDVSNGEGLTQQEFNNSISNELKLTEYKLSHFKSRIEKLMGGIGPQVEQESIQILEQALAQ